jgi:hypothetical protein
LFITMWSKFVWLSPVRRNILHRHIKPEPRAQPLDSYGCSKESFGGLEVDDKIS